MVTADGSERIRLTAEGESASAPVWGTDGRVYFVSDRSGGRHIWSLRPALPPGGAALPDLTAGRAPPSAGGERW
jgi:Tol biopolymer transport system component